MAKSQIFHLLLQILYNSKRLYWAEIVLEQLFHGAVYQYIHKNDENWPIHALDNLQREAIALSKVHFRTALSWDPDSSYKWPRNVFF